MTYNVPMQKIPLLDWTTLRASYSTQYNWLAASNSIIARNLGNTLSNTQTRTINGELNFEQLYNKSRFLRAVNTGPSGNKKTKDSTGIKEPKRVDAKRKQNLKYRIHSKLKCQRRNSEKRRGKPGEKKKKNAED